MEKIFLMGFVLVIFSCSDSNNSDVKTEEHLILEKSNFDLHPSYEIVVEEFNDDKYVDNPDIGYRSELYQKYSHGSGWLLVSHADGD